MGPTNYSRNPVGPTSRSAGYLLKTNSYELKTKNY